MKLSQDQKGMLMLGALALFGIFSFWAASQFTPALAGAVASGMSVTILALISLLAVLIVVLGILMPLFIYFIYCDVKRMREIAEKNERKIEQMRTDFSTLKQMWQR